MAFGLKTSMLKSDLFDFSDAYIVVKGSITPTKTRLKKIYWHKKQVFSI